MITKYSDFESLRTAPFASKSYLPAVDGERRQSLLVQIIPISPLREGWKEMERRFCQFLAIHPHQCQLCDVQQEKKEAF